MSQWVAEWLVRLCALVCEPKCL